MTGEYEKSTLIINMIQRAMGYFRGGPANLHSVTVFDRQPGRCTQRVRVARKFYKYGKKSKTEFIMNIDAQPNWQERAWLKKHRDLDFLSYKK